MGLSTARTLSLGRGNESRLGARQYAAVRGQFGFEQIDVAPPVGQSGAQVEQSGAGCWFEKAHLQRGGQGFDLVMEKAVGHRRVEQSADHAAVQDSGIPLPFRPGPDRGND